MALRLPAPTKRWMATVMSLGACLLALAAPAAASTDLGGADCEPWCLLPVLEGQAVAVSDVPSASQACSLEIPDLVDDPIGWVADCLGGSSEGAFAASPMAGCLLGIQNPCVTWPPGVRAD